MTYTNKELLNDIQTLCSYILVLAGDIDTGDCESDEKLEDKAYEIIKKYRVIEEEA